jgi:hypothetical protein
MGTQSFSRGRFVRRLACAAVAAGTLVGGVVAGEKPAAAQVVWVAPPVVEVDAYPYPAYPDYYWAGGYYGWHHRPYWYGRSNWYYGHHHFWHGGRAWRGWHR